MKAKITQRRSRDGIMKAALVPRRWSAQRARMTFVRLTQFAVDDSTHNRDGLVLHGWDRAEMVTAFISRRVMDDWVDSRQAL
jgi:hypothetical protein